MLEVEKQVHQYDARVMAIHKLRVNVKSLAAEAKMIRREELRAGDQYRWALRAHRVGRVRTEARYAQLALAFVRGRPYRSIEATCHQKVLCGRLIEKVRRAWFSVTDDAVIAWLGETPNGRPQDFNPV